jgi:hypothetical protein
VLSVKSVKSVRTRSDSLSFGSVARVNSVLTRGVQAGSGLPLGGFYFG